ncbi:hypothetical protein QVD17_01918 [Tagetes erecta]|uniref:Uncharacterized protein n=1 Tax=Tagetes erecta TaxID=13708 RepID=A0AAD8P8K2_TARER|nr:hypothetical protein QVD17_01918 [Tagetes erecta]
MLLIKNILSSYDKALFILKSGAQPRAPAFPAPSLPESSISTGSSGSLIEYLKFDQPYTGLPESSLSKKRKGCTTWEDEVRECKVQKCLTTKQVEVHDHLEMGGDIVPCSSFDTLFPLTTSTGLMEDIDQFPNNCVDELWQVFSPGFVSPATSESNIFTEWGSSSSLDSMATPAACLDLDLQEFMSSFL